MDEVEQHLELRSDDLNLIVFYSLLGGSTSLIPIPFLDDWIYTMIRRQMVQGVLSRRNIRLPWDQVRILAARPSLLSDEGCLKLGSTVLFWWPIRFIIYVITKIFKKIFFLLAIKEATDRASDVFHSGFLLDYGVNRIKADVFSTNQWLFPFRNNLWEINRNLDTSPVRSIFWATLRFNRQLLSKAARMFRSASRFFFHSRKNPSKQENAQNVIDKQEKVLGNMAEETARTIMGDKGYLHSLRLSFDQSAQKNGLF